MSRILVPFLLGVGYLGVTMPRTQKKFYIEAMVHPQGKRSPELKRGWMATEEEIKGYQEGKPIWLSTFSGHDEPCDVGPIFATVLHLRGPWFYPNPLVVHLDPKEFHYRAREIVSAEVAGSNAFWRWVLPF